MNVKQPNYLLSWPLIRSTMLLKKYYGFIFWLKIKKKELMRIPPIKNSIGICAYWLEEGKKKNNWFSELFSVNLFAIIIFTYQEFMYYLQD